MEDTHPAVRGTFRRWDKDGHLSRIRDSGWFPFSRELVFAHTEDGSADRLLALALSQGGVQALIRTAPQAVLPQLEAFEKAVPGRSGRSALPHDLQLPAAPGDPPGHGSRHIKSPLSYRLWKEARAAGDCLWGGLFSVRKKPSGTAANKKAA